MEIYDKKQAKRLFFENSILNLIISLKINLKKGVLHPWTWKLFLKKLLIISGFRRK